MKERDVTFDMMKGIAILAMLCGHCVIPDVLHHFIYIWHMPLFFIVSGYFYHTKSWGTNWKSTCRGLLVPYIVTCGLALLLSVLLQSGSADKIIYGTLCVSSAWFGSDTMAGYGGNGPLWFLMALFWCRLVYDALRRWIPSNLNFGGGAYWSCRYWEFS